MKKWSPLASWRRMCDTGAGVVGDTERFHRPPRSGRLRATFGSALAIVQERFVQGWESSLRTRTLGRHFRPRER